MIVCKAEGGALFCDQHFEVTFVKCHPQLYSRFTSQAALRVAC